MDTAKIIRELDAEIARLTSARNILAGSDAHNVGATTHGRNLAQTTTAKGAKRVSRLSAAGRKSLSESMKKRWAERRKKAGSKSK